MSSAAIERLMVPTDQLDCPDSTIVALTLALADPSEPVLYIDKDNRPDGRARVRDAVRWDRPFAITVRRDVLAFDLDKPGEVAAGNDLSGKLQADKRPVLAIDSGRTGHGHLFAVVADSQARAHWKARALARGIRTRRVIRPPGSPHRLGGHVDLGAEALDFLADISHERADRLAEDDRRHPLYWQQTLRTGRHLARHDNSGSQVVWLIAKGAARAGWTFEHFQEALSDPDNAGGEAYRKRLARSPRGADEWLLRHIWQRALIRADQVQQSDQAASVRTYLATVRAAFEQMAWSGKAGTSDRAFVDAVLTRAEQWSLYRVEMSHREIAETTGLSRATVGKAAKRNRLVSADRRGASLPTVGVKEDTGEIAVGRRSTLWSFHLPAEFSESALPSSTPDTPPRRTGGNGRQERAFDDLNRWSGIGLNGGRVINELRVNGPMTATELGRSLGLNIGNLRSRLLPKKLAYLGLVEREGKHWRVVDDLEGAMRAAADHMHLTGRADAVHDRHQQERAEHDAWRAAGSPRSRRTAADRMGAQVPLEPKKAISKLPEAGDQHEEAREDKPSRTRMEGTDGTRGTLCSSMSPDSYPPVPLTATG